MRWSAGAEGLVGNRMMTVRVDPRGSTYDLYFPTVGLHSSVRPREGDLPHSRCHFRAIVGGLAVGRRLDWFTERAAWEPYQQYLGVTNLLTTKLSWRRGPINVMITDMAVMGDCLPTNAGREKSPGQYIKRFWIKNDGTEACRAVFAVYVQAEVNGGVGDVGFSWHDSDRSILAINRGHPHATKKLARDATIEFALALDDRGEVECEPTGPNEAILFRPLELPAGGEVKVDMLISGAFTGWSGDRGTFEHWLRPALNWFRGSGSRQGRVDHGQGVGRLHRADSRPSLSEAGVRRSPAALGAGGGDARRRRDRGGRLGLRSRAERVLLAAETRSGSAARSSAWGTTRSAAACTSGSTRFGSGTSRSCTGFRSTRSTACPNGKRRRSTRPR